MKSSIPLPTLAAILLLRRKGLSAALPCFCLACLLCACPAPQGTTGSDEITPANNEESPEEETSKERETLVVATGLFEGPIDSFIEVSSDVESLNHVDLYPHLTGIQVTEVLADEGDRVEKGEVMAKLDDTEIKLELEQARVAHQEAQQQLEKSQIAVGEAKEREDSALIHESKAKKDFEKSDKLFANELIAEEVLEADQLAWEEASSELDLAHFQSNHASLDLALGRTKLEQTHIAVKNAELKLTRTCITAPFSGMVTYRGAMPGMTVSTANHLFTIVDRDILIANLYIPQEEIHRIKKGMEVQFLCDAIPQAAFSGAISIINPVIDPETGTVKLRATIETTEECLLRPGMFITARIITASKSNALLVLRKAVFYDDAMPTFFLIHDDNSVQKIHFESGATTEKALEILSIQSAEGTMELTGLIGRKIVIVGQDNLKNGDRVKIVKEIS